MQPRVRRACERGDAGTGLIYTHPGPEATRLTAERRKILPARFPRSAASASQQAGKAAKAGRHGKSAAQGKAKRSVFTRFALPPEISKTQEKKPKPSSGCQKHGAGPSADINLFVLTYTSQESSRWVVWLFFFSFFFPPPAPYFFSRACLPSPSCLE